MPSQIFYESIPYNELFEFLEKYAFKTDNFFLVSKDTFKKAKFNNDILEFCKKIKKYYCNCKKFYVTRPQSYKTFLTILRQICKINHLPFTSKIKYEKSTYKIIYYVYFPNQ